MCKRARGSTFHPNPWRLAIKIRAIISIEPADGTQVRFQYHVHSGLADNAWNELVADPPCFGTYTFLDLTHGCRQVLTLTSKEEWNTASKRLSWRSRK